MKNVLWAPCAAIALALTVGCNTKPAPTPEPGPKGGSAVTLADREAEMKTFLANRKAMAELFAKVTDEASAKEHKPALLANAKATVASMQKQKTFGPPSAADEKALEKYDQESEALNARITKEVNRIEKQPKVEAILKDVFDEFEAMAPKP